MSDRLSVADALADGKRQFNWRLQTVRAVLVVVFLATLKAFSIPSTSHTMRVVLTLILIPLAIGGFFEWGAEDRSVDEFQREVRRDAYGVVFRVLFHVLWLLFLIDVGFGLPLSANLPFGLPTLSLSWRDAAVLPLFVYAAAYIVILKRRTRK